MTVARIIRDLAERRENGALRRARLEGGKGGGGPGLLIDNFTENGRRLAQVNGRIGDGYAMRPRRDMNRLSARRAMTVRALVDMVCLSGRDLGAVLVALG